MTEDQLQRLLRIQAQVEALADAVDELRKEIAQPEERPVFVPPARYGIGGWYRSP